MGVERAMERASQKVEQRGMYGESEPLELWRD